MTPELERSERRSETPANRSVPPELGEMWSSTLANSSIAFAEDPQEAIECEAGPGWSADAHPHPVNGPIAFLLQAAGIPGSGKGPRHPVRIGRRSPSVRLARSRALPSKSSQSADVIRSKVPDTPLSAEQVSEAISTFRARSSSRYRPYSQPTTSTNRSMSVWVKESTRGTDRASRRNVSTASRSLVLSPAIVS